MRNIVYTFAEVQCSNFVVDWQVVAPNGLSLLKKSTDEFLRMRTSMFHCQISANWSHISEFSDVFHLSKALQ